MKHKNKINTELKVKNDVIFKELFSKKGNETFLQDFLSGLLKLKINKIEIIKDASLPKEIVREKLGIIDIKATLDDETIVDIEMQMIRYKNMEERALYYSSKLISSQLKTSEFYGRLKKVIVIAVLDYNEYPYEEYITETKTVVSTNEKYEVMKKNKEIEKANEEYEYLTGDEEIQRIAELKQKWQLDYNSWMHDSFEDGVEKGIKEGINKGKSEINREIEKIV